MYSDAEVMGVISDGLEKRWEINDQNQTESTSSGLKKAVQAEIDNDANLRSIKYENPKLQESVISYLNLLDDSVIVLYENSYGTYGFTEKWDKVYDKRTALLKTFVEDYDLKASDKWQAYLDDLVANGTVAQKKSDADEAINSIISKAKFEKSSKGYGYYEYTAIIENTSEYSFTDVSLTLALYDSSGVRASETYTSTRSWDPGEKVKFQATSDVNASEVKTSVDFYSVAD